MLHTYEAVLQPDGRLQFVDPPPTETQAPRRVLVVFTQPMGEPAGTTAASTPTGAEDWATLVGSLKASPNWQGDPQAVQEAMRRDWD